MQSATETPEEKYLMVKLTENELRYLVALGFAVLQNIPEKSLSTYTNFSKKQIIDFSIKVRNIMDENDISM